MKKATWILILMLEIITNHHPLVAQIQTLLNRDLSEGMHLGGGIETKDISVPPHKNKKAADRDDPIFRLRASRGDKWENGWIGADSTIFTYNGQNNLTQSSTKKFDGTIWNQDNRELRQYDANNNLTERIQQNWDGFAWVNQYRFYYEYDIENRKTLELFQEWTAMSWANRNRTSYEYDGNLEIWVSQSWDGTIWKSSERRVIEYNTDGKRTQLLFQSPNGSNWVSSYRVTYQYTGNNILAIDQKWEGNTWINSRQSYKEIDLNGNELSFTVQIWNGGVWENELRFLYAYDANGNLISNHLQIWWEAQSQWPNGNLVLYEYDDDQNLILAVGQQWNGSEFIVTGREKYYYDSFVSTSESDTEPLDIQVSPNPSNGTFFLHAQELEQQPCQVFLYDQLGRQCFQQSCSGLALEAIDGSHLPNGVYILRVIASDGKQVVKQIQISK